MPPHWGQWGRHFPAQYRDALKVFGFALGLRLFFSILLADTFDKDEFVYLALGHDVAHGAVPYRDFGFFHPPGILVLLGLLDPLTALWWPLARLADVLIDSMTATLVWWVGQHLYGRRVALIAGVLYAVNPVVLVSAVRVDQEVIITGLGMAGIALLVTRRSGGTAILAGACLGVACWTKYPMLLFLPVYLLAAWRRAWLCLLGFLAGTAFLFFPYLRDIQMLYRETVTWQTFHRYRTLLDRRLETVAIFWLFLNPFALGALVRFRKPLWLALGFAVGGVFIFTASVYSHYYVLVAPFAALLGAPLAAQIVRLPRSRVVFACVAITFIWGVGIRSFADDHSLVIGTRFSDIRPILQMIDRSTPPGTPILANRLQYAYLAGRPWVGHYFWDDNGLVSARDLEHGLSSRSMAVLAPSADWGSFPPGLTQYLDAHSVRVQVAGSSVWLLSRHRS